MKYVEPDGTVHKTEPDPSDTEGNEKGVVYGDLNQDRNVDLTDISVLSMYLI